MLDQALLGFLRHEPLHGYEIYQRLSEPDGLWLVWRIKQGRLYAMLDRLEEAGYTSATLELQENRPPRKVFHLTAAGAEAFTAWVESPAAHGRDLRLELLVKLFFAWREGPEIAARLIEGQMAQCRAWLAEARASAALVRQEQPYNWLVHQFRIGQLEAMLAWLAQCQSAPLGAPPLPIL